MGKVIGSVGVVLAFIAIIIASLYGYINNILSLVLDVETTGIMIGRVIGIFFAPLGVFLGYF